MSDPSTKILDSRIEAAIEKRITKIENNGGSGYNGGMDAWQTSVENRLSGLDDKIGKANEGISRIEVKLAAMPDKWFIINTILAVAVLVLAAIALGHDLIQETQNQPQTEQHQIKR